jgi:ATP diphosphatase
MSKSEPPAAENALLSELRAIMARLRDPVKGCPWDQVQSFATIAPYTLEEAYEVADAIARDDILALCDELGDLQLQVVYHAQMAAERGAFTLDDVLRKIAEKMIRRHPHVFGDAPSDGWETIKANERQTKGALDGVAKALPALLRAEKLQRRAARTGFDWPDASGPRAKVDEELAETDQAGEAARPGEIGDLLFAVVNWARHLGVDPEAALRGACDKFERRFQAMEARAGDGFAALDLAAKDRLWDEVKLAEAPSAPGSAPNRLRRAGPEA